MKIGDRVIHVYPDTASKVGRVLESIEDELGVQWIRISPEWELDGEFAKMDSLQIQGCWWSAKHFKVLENEKSMTGNPLFTRLPVRFQWTAHNLFAHPLSEILFQVGLEGWGNRIHDWTIPQHDPGTGRG